MALKKSEKRLLIILGIAVVVFIVDRFFLGGDDKPKPAAKPAGAPRTVTAANSPGKTAQPQAKAAPVKPGAQVHYSTWKTDPFAYSYALEMQKQEQRPSRTTQARPARAGQPVQTAVNPTVKEEEKEEEKGPVLNGIFWKDGKAFALIDGIIMEEGEEREGLKVIAIRGSEVVCRKGNRTFTIEWRDS